MNSNDHHALQTADLASLAERKHKVLLRECRVYEKLLDKLELAIDRLDDSENLSAANLTRLLDFAIKLGRLNANMATDHVEHEHAWSQYYDPAFIAQIDSELDKVFGKVIDVPSQEDPKNEK